MRLKWTFWDILGQFGRLYDDFGAFRLYSQTIFTHNRLIEKKGVPDGPTDPRTHGPTNPRTHEPTDPRNHRCMGRDVRDVK